eukprot:s274_g16.t1
MLVLAAWILGYLSEKRDVANRQVLVPHTPTCSFPNFYFGATRLMVSSNTSDLRHKRAVLICASCIEGLKTALSTGHADLETATHALVTDYCFWLQF